MRSIVFFITAFIVMPLIINAQWIKQKVNITASLRGLSVVNEKVVWASGSGGTVIRTINGGETWNVMTIPGAEKLDFRDIEAFDGNMAYVLSIGNGENSRIYKSTTGGKMWELQFKNTNEKAFFDAIACWDPNNCVAMSDPVDGKFLLISTVDGGANWRMMDNSRMPMAKVGEAAFAASGTCLITQGKNNLFLVTGGTAARVFRSNDRGQTWSVADTPIVKGTSGSGIFSIAMRDSKNGVIVGGNYEKPEELSNNIAFTRDGGKTWTVGRNRLNGYRSAVSYRGIDKRRKQFDVDAVGPSGWDSGLVDGRSWKLLDGENYNAVQSNGKSTAWAVGAKGLVVSSTTVFLSH